jgi:hypothetical protein
MTIIAIWLEPDDCALWSVADTRISGRTLEGGTIRRTDFGAKLLPLPIKCHRSVDNYPFRAAQYTTSLGFAYSGAIGPALLTYANSSVLLQYLTTADSNGPPDLSEIAEFVRGISDEVARQYMSASDGTEDKFEIAIFAWNISSLRFEIYHIGPEVDRDSFRMACSRIDVGQGTSPFCMGSGRQRFDVKLKAIMENGDAFGRRTRLPKLAIEALIDEDLADVGGSMSIAKNDVHGFEPLVWVRPIEQGEPPAISSFNGFSVWSLASHVGRYHVSVPGLT